MDEASSGRAAERRRDRPRQRRLAAPAQTADRDEARALTVKQPFGEGQVLACLLDDRPAAFGMGLRARGRGTGMSPDRGAQRHHQRKRRDAAFLVGQALVPRAERLNRDRIMFLAGQASVASKGQPAGSPETTGPQRRAGWAWPAAFATMTGIAASLLLALAIRPAPQVIERFVERIVTAPASPQEPAAAIAERRVEPEP